MRFKVLYSGRCKNRQEFDQILLKLNSGECIKFWAYDEKWPDETVRGMVDYRVGIFEDTTSYPESMGR